MKQKYFIVGLFSILVFALAVSSFVSAQQEAEPKTLEAGLDYCANQQFLNEFNTDILIQKAKEQGFWVRIGLEPNSIYYEGTNICSECSFYKEDEFFKGNRLYAYSDNLFVLYIERDGYRYQISRHKNNITNLFIGFTSKTNIKTNIVKDDISDMFLTLGLFENSDDISFIFSQGKIPEKVTGEGNFQYVSIDSDTSKFDITSMGVIILFLLIIASLIYYKFYRK